MHSFFYFVAYFHHDTKYKSGNEIGQKSIFYGLTINSGVLEAQENVFKHFGQLRSNLDMSQKYIHAVGRTF